MATNKEPRQTHNQKASVVGRRALLEGCLGSGFLALALPGFARGHAQDSPGTPSMPVPWIRDGHIRRVVTGLNGEGKSCVIADESVDISDVWKTSQEQPFGPGSSDEMSRSVHLTGGTRLFLTALPPSKDPKPTLSNRIGFRPTQGIAYCLILSGEIQLLTDQQEVTLRAGDILVERMATHSWRNETSSPVAMLIVRIEA